MPSEIKLDPDAVHFLWKETWVEWDSRVLQVQRAAELYLNRILHPKRRRVAAEASPQTLPLTVAWMLRPNQGRDTLGRVLGEMRISKAKKQVLQSMAGAFPCNAVLHKWGIAPSAACPLLPPSRDAERCAISVSCPQGGYDLGSS
jgi:hypothetical protein